MPEDTEILAKPPPKTTEQTTVVTATTHPLPESHFYHISIRAYLAIMMMGTYCFITIKNGQIDETFKGLVMGIGGMYFVQSKK